MLNKLTIGKKLLLIVAVFSTVLAGMTTYLLMDMRAGMYEDRKAKLRALVEAAVNTVNCYGELAAAGKMPVEEAQKTALAVLTGMNFEGKNYFNTTLTAEQTRSITQAITEVAKSVSGTDQAARQVEDYSIQMRGRFEEMRQEVQAFVARIRAA